MQFKWLPFFWNNSPINLLLSCQSFAMWFECECSNCFQMVQMELKFGSSLDLRNQILNHNRKLCFWNVWSIILLGNVESCESCLCCFAHVMSLSLPEPFWNRDLNKKRIFCSSRRPFFRLFRDLKHRELNVDFNRWRRSKSEKALVGDLDPWRLGEEHSISFEGPFSFCMYRRSFLWRIKILEPKSSKPSRLIHRHEPQETNTMSVVTLGIAGGSGAGKVSMV